MAENKVMPRRRLILMQGKPACGKSTIAEAIKDFLISSSRIVSTDKYLYEGSEYRYTPERQAAAHRQAEAEAFQAMYDEVELVIIDNTNLKFEWCQAYIEAAELFKYDIQVIRVDATPGLQWTQNAMRTSDRKVPLEHFKEIVTQDVLYPPWRYSWKTRLREAWRWIRPER